MVSLVTTEPEAPLQVSGPFPTILLFVVSIPTQGVGATSEVVPGPGCGVGKATPFLPFHDVIGGTVGGLEPAEVGLRRGAPHAHVRRSWWQGCHPRAGALLFTIICLNVCSK